jgi:putative protease
MIQSQLFLPVKIDEIRPRLAIKVQTQEQLGRIMNESFDVIYAENILKIDHPSIIPSLKRIQLRHHETIQGPSLIQDVGHLSLAHIYDLITDHIFNVANIYTIHLLHRLGIKRVTLSPEMSFDRIKQLIPNFIKRFGYKPSLELEVYGRQDLMITKYCPIAKTFKTKPDCHLCEKNQYALEDRMGLRFPLVHDGHCNLRLLHDKPLHLRSYIQEILSLGITCRIHLTVEKGAEIDDVLHAYQMPNQGFYPFEHAKKTTTGRFLK